MNEKTVVDAIQDLTRITLALSDKVESKSDIVRKLNALSVSSTRIASLLAMNPKDVTSIISKHRKKQHVGRKGRS